MEKKHYKGIEMEMTSYDSSKDLMRRGLSNGLPGENDNGISKMLGYLNIMDSFAKHSKNCFEAGFRGIPRIWRRR